MIEYFVKQYGERRTGTNLLRALIENYFQQVEVLMHILGDKHETAIDYKNLQRESIFQSNYLKILQHCTEQKAAQTTDLNKADQQQYLQAIAQGLGKAVKENKLLFFISIKNPFSLSVSLLKTIGWNSTHRHAFKGRYYDDFLLNACMQFNRKYKQWIEFMLKYPEQTCLIRYEDLLLHETQVMKAIHELYRFTLREDLERQIDGIVLPTYWDNNTTITHFEKFDKQFYLEKEYLKLLSPTFIQLLTDNIDWTLMRQIGYDLDTIMQTPFSPITIKHF